VAQESTYLKDAWRIRRRRRSSETSRKKSLTGHEIEQFGTSLRRRLLDYAVALVLLLFPALVLRASLREPSELGRIDRAVLRISSPLQAAVSWVIEGAGTVWTNYVFLVDVEDENDELRAENRHLRRQLAIATQQAAESSALEELVQVKHRTVADAIGARVVAASVNPYFRVIRLRLDRGDGEIKPGMPVVDSHGLVGRIQHVYGSYADVLLVTDPQSSVDVMVERTGGRGVLTGLSREDAYRSEIEYLERGKPVQVGDIVSTSGLGGTFPPGIQVGVIAAVNTKDYGMYQEVEVKPTVDFGRLSLLLVLVAPPVPPDPDAARHRTSELAHRHQPF
jgi:rod shape-determining protein MreC